MMKKRSPLSSEAKTHAQSSWLGTAPDLKIEDCIKTVKADVVVAGSALAEEFAAYSAILEGASVVVLERNGTAYVGCSVGVCQELFFHF